MSDVPRVALAQTPTPLEHLPLGMLGMVRAFIELEDQLAVVGIAPAAVWHAASSGGSPAADSGNPRSVLTRSFGGRTYDRSEIGSRGQGDQRP